MQGGVAAFPSLIEFGVSCIFCLKSFDDRTIEHILPESLGGKEWACLSEGLVCGKCNQYFGAKVEPLALGSFPFLPFRLMLGIPTKKGAAPKMDTQYGTLRGSPLPGHIGIDPSSRREGIAAGTITTMRIIAEPSEPVAVCRFLLKMALEVLAQDSADDARSTHYDDARRFARSPARGAQWWFLLHIDHTALFEKFRRGISRRDWADGVSLRVAEYAAGDGRVVEVFHLSLLDMSLVAPMHAHILPPELDNLPEPEYRLFRVKV